MGLIFGVDPGKSAALSCFDEARLLWVTELRGDILSSVVGAVQRIKQEPGGGREIVIELQYIARGKKANPKTTAALLKRRHTWEILAELYALPIQGVHPSTWQSTQLRTAPRFAEDTSKLSTHQRMVMVASRLWPKVRWTHDMAAAALIARHHQRHGRRRLA